MDEKIGKGIGISRALKNKFPLIFNSLENNVLCQLIDCENNEWCRDYMPIKNSIEELIQFTYKPNYLVSKVAKATIPDRYEIQKEIGYDCIHTNIILDGGAVELFGSNVIISDRVFRDNNADSFYKIDKLRNELQSLLKVNELIIIPQSPLDFTGHVDGLVRFVNERHVVVNDLDEEFLLMKKVPKQKFENYKNWYYSFHNTLLNAGLEITKIPYLAHLNNNADSAVGLYLNFLKTEDCIFVPKYGYEEDQEALDKIFNIYNIKVIDVECNDLAAEGGVLNCVTWN